MFVRLRPALLRLYRTSTRKYSDDIKRDITTKDELSIVANLEQNFNELEFDVEKKSVLEECTEDISHVAPYLKPTFNFAAYVNKSETLQQLLHLGVDLHKLERKPDIMLFILGLKFDNDVKKYVTFLHDNGLSVDEIAYVFTKNPFILKEEIDNLQIRVNYLLSKNFTKDMIQRILSRNPFWMSFSTQDIDKRLGTFQKLFSLKGDEVRHLAARQPKLITYNIQSIKLNMFALKEEMGFNDDELKIILLDKPIVYMKNQVNLLKTFEIIHQDMNVPLEIILQFPGALLCKPFRIRQRHLFLEKLGRAQYDPKKPNYISLLNLVGKSDADFCMDQAKSSLLVYNAFLKTL